VLIGNALRHGWGDVTLTARQFGETLAVDVADEGSIGMESAAVFDRGTSGGEGQRAGLTLARSMAETFGGRLAVGRRSPATFTLLLPGDVPDVMRPRWLAEQRTSPVSHGEQQVAQQARRMLGPSAATRLSSSLSQQKEDRGVPIGTASGTCSHRSPPPLVVP
jgi:hypothetical protein